MTQQQEKFNIALGLAIRTARKDKGLSQEEIGKACGVSRVQIVNVEAGRNSTSVFILAKLKSALDFELPKLEMKEIDRIIKANMVTDQKRKRIDLQIEKLMEQKKKL